MLLGNADLDIGQIALSWFLLLRMSNCFLKRLPLKQIDELLAGSLTAEDEDAVLAELEAITQVWRPLPLIRAARYPVFIIVAVACVWSNAALFILGREKT